MHYAQTEQCELCKKSIYTHNVILVCSLDNKTYHAKCLKIDNDTAYELQKLPDWFCPICLKDNIPYFDTNDTTALVEKCNSCLKLISSSRDCIAHCNFCDKICHKKCINNYIHACITCNARIETDTIDNSTDLNIIYQDISFNPFDDGDDSDQDKNCFFDDNIEDYSETLVSARNLLNNCKYYDPGDIHESKLIGTSFYFNNIDGFQTNFTEFKNQILNSSSNFDFYCFNETNLKSGINHDYEIEEYNSEFHYSIHGKAKGSGIALYYRKNLKFTIDSKLTIRNQYFESLGGKLKCEIGTINVLIIYRYIYNKEIEKLFSHFTKLLKILENKPTVIMGDFNWNVLSDENNNNITTYIDTFICNGFVPMISKPTHFKGESATCIDQIWTNLISDNSFSGIINTSTSAHYPVFGCIPTTAESIAENNESDNSILRTHNINLKNIEKFDRHLTELNANTLITSNDIKSDVSQSGNCAKQFTEYYTKIKSKYDECFLEEVDITS